VKINITPEDVGVIVPRWLTRTCGARGLVEVIVLSSETLPHVSKTHVAVSVTDVALLTPTVALALDGLSLSM